MENCIVLSPRAKRYQELDRLAYELGLAMDRKINEILRGKP